jgi:DNA modification methylase
VGKREGHDASVALVVTSPPYFAGKAYEEALGTDGIPADHLEYLGMLRDVTERILVVAGGAVDELRSLHPA